MEHIDVRMRSASEYLPAAHGAYTVPRSYERTPSWLARSTEELGTIPIMSALFVDFRAAGSRL